MSYTLRTDFYCLRQNVCYAAVEDAEKDENYGDSEDHTFCNVNSADKLFCANLLCQGRYTILLDRRSEQIIFLFCAIFDNIKSDYGMAALA